MVAGCYWLELGIWLGYRILVVPLVACSGVKQEVFLRCKNPGRPLASLFSPLPGGPSSNLPFAMSTDTPSPDPKKKRERGPGRPKAAFTHDATIQLRLTRKQLTELEKQAQRTKMSRSAVIRAALDGVQVLQAAPNEELLKERRQEFFQLAKLATNLNQLVVLVRSAPVVALQTQATIDRVQQVLAEIQQTLPGT